MIKILVVDDKQENLYLLQSLLEFNDFKTIVAKNGAEALGLLRDDLPDLIIADILMPVMDGFTLCRECKKDERLKHIPFFFYTATYTDAKDEEYALSLGADRFILKPQEPEDFLNIIYDFLDEVKQKNHTEIEINPLPENLVLKEYNEVLIRKIEDKMLQTEKSEKELRKYAEELENEIQERIRKEELLQKSEEYNRLLFNTSPTGLLLCRMDGSIVDANPAFANIIGRTVEETFDLTYWDITPEKYAHQEALQLKSLRETGHYGVYEKEYIRKDGHLIPVLLKGLIIKRDGEDFIWSTVEDISERKKAELALKKSQILFQTLAQVSPVGIFRTTSGGETTYVNPKWSELSGLTLEEALGNNWLDAVHPEDREKVIKNWTLRLHTQGYAVAEYRFLRKDGREVWVMGNAVPEHSDNKINGYIGTITDITTIKTFEKELILAKEKAEESDRLKSAFLANMSHEIRTPMNGILSFAELLKEPDLTGEEQQKFISIIEKSGERMLNIINNLIDISKIEAGQMDVKLDETNMNDQVDFIYTFFKPEVEKKGMLLSCHCDLPKNDSIVYTDREKILAVLTNLVKNAIKYTNEGSIEFGYKIVETLHATSLQFYVKDTGIGIPKERQQAIFERFVQADIEDRDARQGAGLGLTITKAYVEMLGGKIWLESQEGAGSTFYFNIPRKTVDERKITNTGNGCLTEKNIESKKLKILIVEDDQTSDEMLTITLRDFSREILHVTTGKEAIDACRQHPDIDLIMMDIKIPGLNGYEATKAIRRFNKNVIIIAQTAYALAGDREKALESGCNEYLSKPIKKGTLIETLNNMFS